MTWLSRFFRSIRTPLPAGFSSARTASHAGGITVHSVQGAQFSYGVAVSGDMRRRGVASSALMLLFETMKSRGFTACVVQIAPDNAASLALHRKLGFVQTGRNAQAVTMEKAL